MQYKEERNRITIAPSNDVEIAYIEEVLGLKREGDAVELVRRNAMNLGCIAYLETKVKPQPRDMVTAWQPRTLPEFLANSSMPDKFIDFFSSFVQDMLKDVKDINTYESDEQRMFYIGELESAFKSGNFVRIATLAMLLSRLTE